MKIVQHDTPERIEQVALSLLKFTLVPYPAEWAVRLEWRQSEDRDYAKDALGDYFFGLLETEVECAVATAVGTRLRTCVCGKRAYLVRDVDRFFHEDGTNNRDCWLRIGRGGE